ncbi:lysozyme inhibitor LprI family protein [Allorhizobium sp. BGMRC 0089]|uniref:lysozyme inhibitor LprI family protein n=1 Tax=Allorhizobium sonneratiae TaxID=2934936 RepID=UPI002033DFB8|nr:lysozyme inhibitor LprI family protein [Allorhizobium sonneratiae]MCM2293680.1 lysozyme inhibitor LprI family protein [Allorhizobium sonneratiae]
MRLPMIVLAVAALALPYPRMAVAASFDCTKASLMPDEKTICANRDLNDLDVKMVTTFDLLSGLLAMGSRGDLQDQQAAWLKTRQACGPDAACIRKAYDIRLQQLKDVYDHLPRPI